MAQRYMKFSISIFCFVRQAKASLDAVEIVFYLSFLKFKIFMYLCAIFLK
jgi:hypothetical protein